MQKVKIIFSKRKAFFVILTATLLVGCNYKTKNSIEQYTEEVFFKSNYNVKILECRILNQEEISSDSVANRFVKDKLLELAINISGSYDNLTPEIIDRAASTKEFIEYKEKMTRFNGVGHKINVFLKVTYSNLEGTEQKNYVWDNLTFYMNNNFELINSPIKFNQSDNKNYNESTSSNYRSINDNELIQAFKNYMLDSYFDFKTFEVKGKTIRINVGFVMNTRIREIQRENESIFDELLKRFDKIVFWDEYGESSTITRMN